MPHRDPKLTIFAFDRRTAQWSKTLEGGPGINKYLPKCFLVKMIKYQNFLDSILGILDLLLYVPMREEILITFHFDQETLRQRFISTGT